MCLVTPLSILSFYLSHVIIRVTNSIQTHVCSAFLIIFTPQLMHEHLQIGVLLALTHWICHMSMSTIYRAKHVSLTNTCRPSLSSDVGMLSCTLLEK